MALCVSEGPPTLVRSGHTWSRQEVCDWLRGDLPPDTLVGLDLGGSLPFADRGAYFPGWSASPRNARALWALIETICADEPNLAANAFVDHAEAARHFRRHGGRVGDLFTPGRGRLRVTEEAQRRQGLNPYSNLNLVGAAQVGKSSLTGMRVLHRLAGHVAIWPFDPLPPTGSVVVEIYTTIAALAAGRTKNRAKMRSYEDLNAALDNLCSAPVPGAGAIDDHKSDALLTAAWLRIVATSDALWRPRELSPQLAATEGWTFGVT